MSDNGETETTKRTRKPRSRISYADRCREYEQAAAVQQAKIGIVLTLIRNLVVEAGSGTMQVMAADLIGEMIE